MRNVTKAINQWYSANLAQEVVKGLRENAMSARNTGGPPPLGYAVDKATGKFVIAPREAEAVQLIFRLYLQDVGYAGILDALSAGGYTTRRGRPFGKIAYTTFCEMKNIPGCISGTALRPQTLTARPTAGG